MMEKCLKGGVLLRNLGTRIMSSAAPGKLDPVQESLLSELCILVDKEDNIIGQASKRECHQLVGGASPLHRAFSLFIFNQSGELLLQKRSDSKITFPGMWTNSCCSHPLMQGDEPDGVRGTKLAARRRSTIELGIPESQLDVEKMHYLTRILYHSPSDGEWGEHELDYILFLRNDVDPSPNPEEVSATEWVKREHLQDFIKEVKSSGGAITPWFDLVSRHLLHHWWTNLDNIHNMAQHNKIHSFVEKS